MSKSIATPYSEPVDVLRRYWGHDSFRSLQEDIVRSAMSGRDTLALLPTGGGKSICFQVPAMAMPGVCIVISPLIALMQDQVHNLTERGIAAVAVHTGMKRSAIDKAMEAAAMGEVKFLYLSPERLQTDMVRLRLQRMRVNLLAVDEAHCISQWGYDFRPPYLLIAEVRSLLPLVPILALTATATPRVVNDIMVRLAFKDGAVFRKSFARPELAYMVVQEEDTKGRMLRILGRVPGSAIVYVRNRRRTKEVADHLMSMGISTTYYHAGLSHDERTRRQHDWVNNRMRVVVATNAFGMGIDKPDVRCVIHLGFPDTLEAYFQEAGRGARDGKKAFAVALVNGSTSVAIKESMEASFPDKALIVNVYRAICSQLRLAEGAGSEEWFDMHTEALSERTGLTVSQIYTALGFLQREGYLYITEPERAQSTVHIIVSPETLYQEEVRDERVRRVLQVLLRSYGALFEDEVAIDLHRISKRSGLTTDEIAHTLQTLHGRKLLKWRPATGLPRINLVNGAMASGNVRISREGYEMRKEVRLRQMKAVVHYLENTTLCRSVLLLSYFGEQTAHTCGQCDVCLSLANESVSTSDSDSIALNIRESISKGPISSQQLPGRLGRWPEKKVLRVLQRLMDDNLIKVDNFGYLTY